MSDTFPRQHARTQRLTLGEPRSFTISPDGERVLFTRSHHGSDPVNTLWLCDLTSGTETEILDPRTVPVDASTMTPEEARRRERAREGAGGIVSYACDTTMSRAVTVLGGQIVVVDLITGALSMPPIEPGVFDARLSPDGTLLSYTRGADLYVSSLTGEQRLLAGEQNPQITWGLAEFIAAEEMGRSRGYWWSPDSRLIAATRVDTGNIPTIAIADPATPTAEPVVHAYPFAGTTNARVTLHILDAHDPAGVACDVTIPGEWEYLNSVSWTTRGLIIQVQSRDQKEVWIHRVDPTTGSCTLLATDTDTSWVELVPGTPVLDTHGRLVQCADRGGVRALVVDGENVSPSNLQVRSVVSAADTIVYAANEIERPWSMQIYRYHHENRSTDVLGDSHGINTAVAHDHCAVIRHVDLTTTRARFDVISSTPRHMADTCFVNHAEEPLVSPRARLVEVGPERIPVAIITPSDDRPGPLPVLFDPYGGPHAQRVVESRSAHATSQWFADQGFIVVVADNVGTPGRGSAWERGVDDDLATPVLEHQVQVVRALSDIEPRADISRVAIRGWSFGGYLAALAVLRRPDVFHAAIAGAPVTDWALYDTHYTERYLGIDTSAISYTSTSLLHDAANLTRPLLLIHGLADDNVVAAHTLQLSSALLAAGKYHEVLPLSGVTHMTPQEVVAENLLLHQLQFLRRWLAVSDN